MFNYILHPTNLRNRDLELEMRIEEGARGYGIYIMILELLRDADNYRIKNKPKSISFAINEPDADTVTRIINNYGLFETEDDIYIYSQWLRDSLQQMDAKRAALSEAGKRGAAARKNNTHHEQDNAKHNTGISQVQAKPSSSQAQAKPNQTLSISTNNNNKKNNKSNNSQGLICDNGSVLTWDMIEMFSRSTFEPIDQDKLHIEIPNDGVERNPQYIIRVAVEYEMSIMVLNLLMMLTDYGRVGGKRMMQLIKIIKKCREDNFKPLYWGNYIAKKMEEQG